MTRFVTDPDAANAPFPDKALDPPIQGGAIGTILDPKNLTVPSPVFVTILRLVRSVYGTLLDHDNGFVDETLMQLHEEESPRLSVALNLSDYIQTHFLGDGQVRVSAITIQ